MFGYQTAVRSQTSCLDIRQQSGAKFHVWISDSSKEPNFMFGYQTAVRSQISCLDIRQQSGAKRLVCTLISSAFPFWKSKFRMKARTHTYFTIGHISSFLILTILKLTIILPLNIVKTSDCVNNGIISYQFKSPHQRRLVGLSYVWVGG